MYPYLFNIHRSTTKCRREARSGAAAAADDCLALGGGQSKGRPSCVFVFPKCKNTMGYNYYCPNNIEVRSAEEKKEEANGSGYCGTYGYGYGDAVALRHQHHHRATLDGRTTSLECSLNSLQIDARQFHTPQQQQQSNILSSAANASEIHHPTLPLAAAAAHQHHYHHTTVPFSPTAPALFSFGRTVAMPSLLATTTATSDPTIIAASTTTPPTLLPTLPASLHAMTSIIVPHTPTVTTTGLPTPVPTIHHSHHHQQHQQQTTIFPSQIISIPPYIPPTPSTWACPTTIPTALTVQDRPLVPPIYNGINPNYPNAQLLHAHPPIFIVENFLTAAECDFLIDASTDALGPAPVVGKGGGEVSPSRTSSTCYLAREDLPEYIRKVCLLTGQPPEHCELPQVGRYLPSQQYLQHFDAFDIGNEDGRRFASNGGQRIVTVLVYLNDVPRGGATSFPNLNLVVQPRRGMALIFFPSTLDGLLDKMALHAALPAVDVKYVSQVWIRQSKYEGQPSKRLPMPMGPGWQEMRDVMMAAQAQSGLLVEQQQQQQQQQHHLAQHQLQQQHHLAHHVQQHLQQGQLQQHEHGLQHGFVQMKI